MHVHGQGPGAAAPDATRVGPYLRRLFALLALATLFEGFDTLLVSLSLPYFARDFGVAADVAGRGLSVIATGTVAAFLPIRLADRIGRRPVLLGAVLGYTLFTLATAFTQSLGQFVACQIVARMFMVCEIALAFIVLSEEMPAAVRGRANAFLMAMAGVGGILAALSFRATIELPLGWRGLYLLGGLLLPAFPFYLRGIRETGRWTGQARERPLPGLLDDLRHTRAVFRPPLLGRSFAAASLWFTTNLWTGSAVFWFNYYVVEERGWSPELIGIVLPVASIVGFGGYFLTGPAMDFVGRRFTAVFLLAAGGIATIVCFSSRQTWLIAVSYGAFMTMQSVWSVAGTLTSELYPTALRATGSAVTNNLIGRFGMILAGWAVGALSVAWLGSVGRAVALLACVNFLCVPVVLVWIPETRGRALEEIG